MKLNEEISISGIELLLSIIKRWKMIIGGSLAVGFLTALVAVFVLAESFSTTATMLVVRNPLTSGYTPKTLTIPSMQPLLESDEILHNVMDKSGIREYNDKITLSSFRRMLDIDIFIEQDTNVAKAYSPLVRLKASGPTPELAKIIVDEWVMQASQRLNEVLTKELEINIEIVGESYDEYLARLKLLQEQIMELNAVIPLIEAELSYLKGKRTDYMASLRNLGIDIAKKEAILREVSARYEEERDILTLRRTITEDAFWQAMIQSDPRLGDILQAGLGNEQLNPIYMDLKSRRINERITLEGFYNEQESMEISLKDVEENITLLNKELNMKKMEREVLEKEKSLVHGKFNEYQGNKMQLDIEERLASRMLDAEEGQFRFVKAATWGVIDPQRDFPQRTLIVLVATFFAFWGFVALALIIDLLKKAGIPLYMKSLEKEDKK